MEGEKKSFWTTLPGTLTAIAGILGSIVAILSLIFSSSTPDPVPQIDEFLSIPAEITSDQEATLKWKASAAADAKATIDQNIGEVPLVGTLMVKPDKTTTYILTINNKGEIVTESTTVFVNQEDTSSQEQREIGTSFDSALALVVDKMGRGDYTTISEAISAAVEGSTILVRKGVYDEGITVTKPLEILGEGLAEDVVIRASGDDVIYFNAPTGKVSNLKLLQRGGGEYFSVDIAGGSLELNGCDISSDSLSCVAIHGNAYPTLRGNKIHDGKQGGIFVYENGEGVIEDNDIYGNEQSGINIMDGGNPTIRRNKIHDGKQDGIYIYENGEGLIEDNDIYGNELSGIEIKESGNPTVRGNKIHDGKANGILVDKNGEGMIEDNDIFGNENSGIVIREGGNPTVRGNKIHDGKASGILVDKNGEGMIEDNDIFGNENSGIEIREGGNPTVRGNKIHGGKHNGIYVHDNGEGVIEDNDIFGNENSGIEIREGGNPTLRKNRIKNNDYIAIGIYNNGGGRFEDNDLRDNKMGPWDISEDSEANTFKSGNIE